jgi:hypothetical protein
MNWPTTERPRLLVVFSTVAFLIAVVIGLLAFLDQTQRINNPQRYAERRCRGVLATSGFTPRQFASCVAKERAKSTIASIFPLMVAGILVASLGLAGFFIGRAGVRLSDERMRKVKGEDS